MKITEARLLVEQIPVEHQQALSAAHARYMHFTGVHQDEVDEAQIERDRAQFAHLLKFTADGKPSLSDKHCSEFMAAVTGLSLEWCLAWDEVEFCNEHGDNYFERKLKRQESDRLGELNTYLDIRAFTAKGEARFNYMVLHAYGHRVEMMPNLVLRCQAACLKDMNVYLSQGVDLAWEIALPGEDVPHTEPKSTAIWFKPESGDLIVQRCRFHEEHRNYPQEVEVL